MIEKLCMAMITETLSRVRLASISDNDKWSFIPVIYCNDKVFSIAMINATLSLLRMATEDNRRNK